MAYRARMPKKRSKRVFSATASRTHKKNVADKPMRGGIRL